MKSIISLYFLVILSLCQTSLYGQPDWLNEDLLVRFSFDGTVEELSSNRVVENFGVGLATDRS